MPELGWRYGYAFSWLLILLSIVGLLVYFRRKRWL
jgi:magnesium transporter